MHSLKIKSLFVSAMLAASVVASTGHAADTSISLPVTGVKYFDGVPDLFRSQNSFSSA